MVGQIIEVYSLTQYTRAMVIIEKIRAMFLIGSVLVTYPLFIMLRKFEMSWSRVLWKKGVVGTVETIDTYTGFENSHLVTKYRV